MKTYTWKEYPLHKCGRNMAIRVMDEDGTLGKEPTILVRPTKGYTTSVSMNFRDLTLAESKGIKQALLAFNDEQHELIDLKLARSILEMNRRESSDNSGPYGTISIAELEPDDFFEYGELPVDDFMTEKGLTVMKEHELIIGRLLVAGKNENPLFTSLIHMARESGANLIRIDLLNNKVQFLHKDKNCPF